MTDKPPRTQGRTKKTHQDKTQLTKKKDSIRLNQTNKKKAKQKVKKIQGEIKQGG